MVPPPHRGPHICICRHTHILTTVLQIVLAAAAYTSMLVLTLEVEALFAMSKLTLQKCLL